MQADGSDGRGCADRGLPTRPGQSQLRAADQLPHRHPPRTAVPGASEASRLRPSRSHQVSHPKTAGPFQHCPHPQAGSIWTRGAIKDRPPAAASGAYRDTACQVRSIGRGAAGFLRFELLQRPGGAELDVDVELSNSMRAGGSIIESDCSAASPPKQNTSADGTVAFDFTPPTKRRRGRRRQLYEGATRGQGRRVVSCRRQSVVAALPPAAGTVRGFAADERSRPAYRLRCGAPCGGRLAYGGGQSNVNRSKVDQKPKNWTWT